MKSRTYTEQPYRVRYVRHSIPAVVTAGSVLTAGVVVENRGTEPWPIHPGDGHEVSLAVFQNGSFLMNALLDQVRIEPGSRGVGSFTYRAPPDPGSYLLGIDLVRQGVAMFEEMGNAALSVPVLVTPTGRGRLRDRLRTGLFDGRHRDLPLAALAIRWRACQLASTVLPRRSRARSRVLGAWKRINETLALRELLTRRARLRSLPSCLSIDTTVRCNLRCRLCVRQTKAEDLDLRHDLPLVLLERIVAGLFPTARSVNISLAGEPLLTPHLDYLLDAMEEHGVHLSLLTNGTLLDRPIVRERIVPLLDSLEVSLDSTDQALSDRLRAGDDRGRVLANLRDLAAIRRSLPDPVFPFGLSVTLTSVNLDQLPGLIAMAAELGCTSVRGCFAVIFRPEDLELSVFNVPGRYNEISRLAREQALELGISLSIPGPIEINENREESEDRATERGVCPFLYSVACVDHRGRLASCLHYDPPFAVPYGTADFRAFWNSEPLRNLRRDHDTGRAHRSCRDCHIILRGSMSAADRRRQFLPEAAASPASPVKDAARPLPAGAP